MLEQLKLKCECAFLSCEMNEKIKANRLGQDDFLNEALKGSHLLR